jgi:NADPH-dependent curcumin reductase CurA
MKSWAMRRPTANLTIDDFMLRDMPPPEAGDGEILVETHYISLDPYLSRAMKSWKGEHPGWADGTIHGRIVGTVIESRFPGLSVGDRVIGIGRWQPVNAMPGQAVQLIAPDIDPPSLVLGALGRSGITAWVGLHLSGLKAGETILISAATGPVGSVAAQLAKARGCHVIGTAGGEAKCRHATDLLGYDACIDHGAADLEDRLKAAAGEGVDVLFENVGASSLDAALPLMRPRGRIMLCGLAQHYLTEDPMLLRNFKYLLYSELSLRAFITANYPDLFAPALEELRDGILSGRLLFQETIIDGLDNAADTFLAMLGGEGIGKRLIRL